MSNNKTVYRLSFGGTRKKIIKKALKAAMSEALYWTRWGQSRVCIDRKPVSGKTWTRVKCVYRAGVKRSR